MILQLKDLYDKLKNIRTYLIKIGPNRRQGQIIIKKLEEAKIFYSEYTLLISELNEEINKGNLSTQDTDLVTKLSFDFQSLYTDIEFLCTKNKSSDFKDKVSDITDSEINVNMAETFNLKTALSLLTQMTDDELNTKQLIDNIEYYASVLEKDECKRKLIQFVLRSRLSQGAKLKLKCSYSNATDLINDMRKELLPQKSAPAIQDKLQKCRQNNLNIQDYGKEITEMFVRFLGVLIPVPRRRFPSSWNTMALIFPALAASVTMFTKATETCFHRVEARHVHHEEDEDKRVRGKGFKRQEWRISEKLKVLKQQLE